MRRRPGPPVMRPALRARQLVNLANGSTLAGLAVAAAGRARLASAGDGLLAATGYRLRLPPAPAFCLGNVIITRRAAIDPGSPLFRHEARHATQYAWCGGIGMVPLYLAAAAASWALTGDVGARNVFERRAGLADGGYSDAALRPAVAALRPAVAALRPALASRPARISRSPRTAAVPGPGRPAGRGPAAAGPAGSSASPSR